MSCSVAQIIVPSCVEDDVPNAQLEKINKGKELKAFTFKVADNK